LRVDDRSSVVPSFAPHNREVVLNGSSPDDVFLDSPVFTVVSGRSEGIFKDGFEPLIVDVPQCLDSPPVFTSWCFVTLLRPDVELMKNSKPISGLLA